MSRYTRKQHQTQILAVTTVYLILMFAEWPHVRSVSSLPWKIALALVPVAPILVTIWLIAKRVMHSDELEQRLHLLALSIATAFICALTLVGGFLTAAGVLELGGDVLIWVAPVLSFVYGVVHLWLGRRYGGSHCA